MVSRVSRVSVRSWEGRFPDRRFDGISVIFFWISSCPFYDRENIGRNTYILKAGDTNTTKTVVELTSSGHKSASNCRVKKWQGGGNLKQTKERNLQYPSCLLAWVQHRELYVFSFSTNSSVLGFSSHLSLGLPKGLLQFSKHSYLPPF